VADHLSTQHQTTNSLDFSVLATSAAQPFI
jgi:hypothetical protein